jgi:predicted double-glycine peptidase
VKLSTTFALTSPFRFVRHGALLLLAALTWTLAPHASQAQVRFHGEAGGTYTLSVMSWRDIPFRTVVRQQYDFSCGSAAVATLLRFHYGQSDVHEAEVFRAMYDHGDQARIRQVGFSMLDMRDYLNSQGFQTDGLRLSLDRLQALNEPTIALITRNGYRHFIVIKGISTTSVLVGDPTFGLQTYSRHDFEAMWNGVVLAVRHEPTSAPPAIYNQASEWRPWAVAPVGDAHGPVDPQQLTSGFREIYQVTPISPGSTD